VRAGADPKELEALRPPRGTALMNGFGWWIRRIAGDLSSRATEQELIQIVRAEADDVDGPNLLG
jgi:hypothetical protein